MSTYPSVTTILKPWQDFSQIPEDVLNAACERGKRVHGACAALALKLFVPPMPEELQGYLASFRTWLNQAVAEVLSVEQRMVNEPFGFCGRPDMVVKIRGDENYSVCDLKTPVPLSKAWRLQIAAYRYLSEQTLNVSVPRALIVRLKKDGKPPIVTEYSPKLKDFNVFLHALSAYRFFKEECSCT